MYAQAAEKNQPCKLSTSAFLIFILIISHSLSSCSFIDNCVLIYWQWRAHLLTDHVLTQAAAANVNNDISDDDIPRAKKQQLVCPPSPLAHASVLLWYLHAETLEIIAAASHPKYSHNLEITTHIVLVPHFSISRDMSETRAVTWVKQVPHLWRMLRFTLEPLSQLTFNVEITAKPYSPPGL
jgi:hypothetical protein